MNQLFSTVNTLVYLIRICISTVHSVVRASKQEARRPGKQLANYGRYVHNYTPHPRVKSGLRGPILLGEKNSGPILAAHRRDISHWFIRRSATLLSARFDDIRKSY